MLGNAVGSSPVGIAPVQSDGTAVNEDCRRVSKELTKDLVQSKRHMLSNSETNNPLIEKYSHAKVPYYIRIVSTKSSTFCTRLLIVYWKSPYVLKE